MWIVSKDLASLPRVLPGLSLWLASADACILGPLKPCMQWPLAPRSYLSDHQCLLNQVVTIHSIFFFFSPHFFCVCYCTACGLLDPQPGPTSRSHSSKSTELCYLTHQESPVFQSYLIYTISITMVCLQKMMSSYLLCTVHGLEVCCLIQTTITNPTSWIAFIVLCLSFLNSKVGIPIRTMSSGCHDPWWVQVLSI